MTKEIEVEVHTSRFVRFPCHPERPHTIEHLFQKKDVGKGFHWACDDCGKHYDVHAYPNGSCKLVEREGFGTQRDIVLLEIPPLPESLWLKVRGYKFEPRSAETENSRRYYYEESTCPVNCFRCADEIRIGDDTDPHGLFKYHYSYDADVEVPKPPQLETKMSTGIKIVDSPPRVTRSAVEVTASLYNQGVRASVSATKLHKGSELHELVGMDPNLCLYWVNRAIVDPEAIRGQGWGTKLLQAIQAEVDALVVCPGGYANNYDRQNNFYARSGFKIVKQYPDGTAVMSWRRP